MASASSTSAKNLFQDSKRRLSERVQVNVNNIGSVTRQIMRGSKSQEMLMQTAKNFSQAESTMENTFNNLQKMQVLMAQLNQSQISIENSVSKLPEVQEQIRDMQRWHDGWEQKSFAKWMILTKDILYIGMIGSMDFVPLKMSNKENQ